MTEWTFHPGRFAVHEPTRTAVVADLHLGYDRVRARRGEAVPFRDIREELRPLGGAMSAIGVARLLVAGDLFERARVQQAVMVAELLSWADTSGVTLVGVVPGNHDRGLKGCDGLALFEDGYALGDWTVVHGDGAIPAGKVVHGHDHPCLRLPGGAAGPCFLVRDDRIVLPAWSEDAAGVNVLGDRRWREYGCRAVAGGKVLDFGTLADLMRRLGRLHGGET